MAHSPALELTLFHTPGTSSRVIVNALEEAGLAYKDHAVDIFRGAQHQPEYRRINSKAKVPVLLIARRLLTETPAILRWLIETCPEAGLIPAGDALFRAQAISDFDWIAGTLHPLVRAIRMPQRITSGDPEAVRAMAIDQMQQTLSEMERRFRVGGWWHGEIWSITDVYLNWAVDMCCAGGMELTNYPAVAAQRPAVRARASFQRALAREQQALDSAEITLPNGATL